MFNLNKPCVDCPFRKDSSTHQTLAEGRIPGIVESMYADGHFVCHKTLNKQTSEIAEGSLLCKGSLLYMERDGVRNQVMQVGERLGWYDGRPPTMEDGLIDVIPNINKGWYARYDKTIK